MHIQKPQHKTTTSDFFICFTSSKSILTHNGSLRKGAQSPAMFPLTTTSKNSKKNKTSKSTLTNSSSNSNSNNHEPSSPKVTCIGQVRVKTKKQGKKMKMLAFRKMQNGSRNHSQRWVHLPFTICESLKCFTCDFSCLIPCKSSCFSSKNSNDGGKNGSKSCCGSVFSWMVSFNDGEGKKNVELVVGGVNNNNSNNNDGSVIERVCSRRRSIFDDVEFDDLFNNNTVRDDNGSGSGLVSYNDIKDDNGLGSSHVLYNVIRDDNGSGSGHVSYNEIRDGNGSGLGEINPNGIRNRDDNESGLGYNGIKNRDDNGLSLVRGNDNGIKVFRDDNGSGLGGVGYKGIRVFRDDNGLGLGRGNGNGIRDDNGSGSGGDEEFGRVSVCVPPKNALLLMRCRSDPSRMASLSHKFWDPPLVEQVDKGDFRVDGDVSVVFKEVSHGEIDGLVVKIEEIKDDIVKLVDGDEEIVETCGENVEVKLDDENIVQEEVVLHNVDEPQLIEGDGGLTETSTVEETNEEGEDYELRGLDIMLEDEEMEVQEKGELEEGCVNSSDNSSEESKELEPKLEKEEKVEKVTSQGEARKSIDKENKNKSMLPDCLLLMMCEPKLSMEVSKETWVCSNDFIRCLPERNKNKKGSKTECGDDQITSSNGNSNSNKKTKAAAVAAHPPLPPLARGGRSGIQPGRSSISFPTGGGSVANLIEEKLAKAGVGFEPFALTRCKSAPLRSTAKFVPPELACSVWGRGNGPKLEPHRPATCGVGAAGVGA